MKVERTQALAWREVGDEIVVIHLGRHRIFGLSGAGAAIWQALEQPKQVEELCQLAGGPETAAEGVFGRVLSFVADLAGEDLVACDGIVPAPTPNAETGGADQLRIAWREDVRQFAGQCDFQPGQSELCTQYPGGS